MTVAVRQRAYRASNREAYRGYYRKFRAGRSAFLDVAKSFPCLDCGSSFPPECMDFDHVRGEKLFGIGLGVRRAFNALRQEIAKCELVCANCHRSRTRRNA